MKSLGFLSTLFVLVPLLSCSKSQFALSDLTLEVDFTTKGDNPSMSFIVTEPEATRLVFTRFPNKQISDVIPFVVGSDTLFRIFNFDDGWVAIAGDKRIQPLLGAEGSNRISNQDLDNHKGIKIWTELLKEDVLSAKKDLSFDNKYYAFWKRFNVPKRNSSPFPGTKSGDEPVWALFYDYTEYDYTDTHILIPHLLSTKWGNWNPWNYKCPLDTVTHNGVLDTIKCPTGCTGVAMAQLLYYYHSFPSVEKPNGLYHTISCSGNCIPNYSFSLSRSDYNANSSRWNEMALTYYGLGNTDYVGDLIMDVSDRVGMHYTATGSGALPTVAGFGYYNLDCTLSQFNTSTVKNSLLAYKPVLVYAFTYDYSAGHTWVIDGFAEKWAYYTNYYHLEYTTDYDDAVVIYVDNEIETEYEEYYEGMIVDEQYYTVSDCILMNWGYNGNHDDGVYYIGSVWQVNMHNYVSNRTIIYNFH